MGVTKLPLVVPFLSDWAVHTSAGRSLFFYTILFWFDHICLFQHPPKSLNLCFFLFYLFFYCCSFLFSLSSSIIFTFFVCSTICAVLLKMIWGKKWDCKCIISIFTLVEDSLLRTHKSCRIQWVFITQSKCALWLRLRWLCWGKNPFKIYHTLKASTASIDRFIRRVQKKPNHSLQTNDNQSDRSSSHLNSLWDKNLGSLLGGHLETFLPGSPGTASLAKQWGIHVQDCLLLLATC